MSDVDGDLRRLAQERLQEPILAMAQFRAGVPRLFSGILWSAEGRYNGRAARLPSPAYLVITTSRVVTFSARFSPEVKVIGPTNVWTRSEIRARRSTSSPAAMCIRWSTAEPEVEIEAAEPGTQSGEVIRLLCDITGRR